MDRISDNMSSGISQLKANSLSEIDNLYKKHLDNPVIKEIATDASLLPEESFFFYIFDLLGTEKIEDPVFMSNLITFLDSKELKRYKDESSIRRFMENNIFYIQDSMPLKYKYIFGPEPPKFNIYFIKNIFIKKSLTDKRYSKDYKIIYNSSEIFIADNFTDEYYYLVIDGEEHKFVITPSEKEQLMGYLELMNIENSNENIKRIHLIESKASENNIPLKNIIYNFIDEIDENYFIVPLAFMCLEYVIRQKYYLGEYGDYSADEKFGLEQTLVKHQKTFKDIDEIQSKFHKLVVIVSKRIDVNRNLVAGVTWHIFRKQIIKKFADKWDKGYGDFFVDIKLNLHDYLSTYCTLNEIDALDPMNIGYIHYYLMQVGLIEESKNFLDSYNYVSNEIKLVMDDVDLIKFEMKLTKTPIKYQQKQMDFNDLDLLSGYEFEQFVAELFIEMGYYSRRTKGSGDQGIDVLAEKNGKKIGIQTKCYGTKVNNSAVQETVAGIAYYNCDRGIVITNNYFTKSAVDLAAKNDIVLWDRNMLREKFNEFM